MNPVAALGWRPIAAQTSVEALARLQRAAAALRVDADREHPRHAGLAAAAPTSSSSLAFANARWVWESITPSTYGRAWGTAAGGARRSAPSRPPVWRRRSPGPGAPSASRICRRRGRHPGMQQHGDDAQALDERREHARDRLVVARLGEAPRRLLLDVPVQPPHGAPCGLERGRELGACRGAPRPRRGSARARRRDPRRAPPPGPCRRGSAPPSTSCGSRGCPARWPARPRSAPRSPRSRPPPS